MYSVFENLPEEKKQNIIKCALKEFADKGYEQASTNAIVKEAGISKGILFHYFKTKRDLYRYVIFYCIDLMYTQMLDYLEFSSDDYFERMLEVSAAKMKVQMKYPEIYTIVVNIFKSSQQDIIKEIYEKYAPLITQYYAKVNTGIAMSKFKEGVDIGRVNEIVTWIAEGMGNKIIKEVSNKAEDIEETRKILEDEFRIYADMLKKGVYRE